MTTNNQMTIKALLKERQGYVKRNLDDRVASVNKCLQELGFQIEGAAVKELETATISPTFERAVSRKAPPKKRT